MDSISTTIENIIPNIKQLWLETFGDSSIKIAIIDGPVDTKHPTLASANLEIQETHVGFDLDQSSDLLNHGTHVTSIIFGQHSSQIKGIAPHCTGLILPVFKDSNKNGVQLCSQIDLARTILQACAAGAHIINISGGEYSVTGNSHPILMKAINHCSEQGILIIAATGNNGCECLHIPGALPSVLAVGAMDKNGIPLEFSNWGKVYHTQGILAPGEGIFGASAGGGVVKKTGTSFATPIISGIAGLLLSYQKKLGVKPNANQIKEALLESAVGCIELNKTKCQRLLKGRVNIIGVYNTIQKKITKMDKSVNNLNLSDLDESLEKNSFKEEIKSYKPNPNEMKVNNKELQRKFTDSSLIKEQEVLNKGIELSECDCGSKDNYEPINPQLVFAIGRLGFDFELEARRDSIAQHMIEGNPNDPKKLLEYLEVNPWDADAIIWTLCQDSVPIYAVRPMGAFAAEGHKRIQQFLNDQINQVVEFVSIPGIIIGQIRLMSGEIVPLIKPELRCMYSWNIELLINELGVTDHELQEDISNFFQRLYHEFRNLGITPQERSLNYAGTNAFNAKSVFAKALKDKMQLDTIEVEPSPIYRPGSNSWDIKLIFFHPQNQLQKAKKVYRYTVDVSDVCPVMVGPVRTWFMR